MPTIRVDDDVYAVINRGIADGISANTALRAALGLPTEAAPQPVSPTPPAGRAGKLRPLIDAGLLRPGQEVTWRRRLREETHTATVSSSGCMVTADGHETISPDAAATAVAGYPCTGWKRWRTSDGTTLDQLRSRYLAQHATPDRDQQPVDAPQPSHTDPATEAAGADR